MDKDALEAEFEALVEPFERSREHALSIAPRDMPGDRILQIVRQMKENPAADMPKLLDEAEAASLFLCRLSCSLLEERDAVYNKFIDKLIHKMTSQKTTNAQESVDTHQDTPANTPDTTQAKDQTKDHAKKQDKPAEPQATRHVAIPEATAAYINRLNDSHHWRMGPFRRFRTQWQQARDKRAERMKSNEVKWILAESGIPDTAEIVDNKLRNILINTINNKNTVFPVRAATTEFLRETLNETLELHDEAIEAFEDIAELDRRYPEMQECFQIMIAASVREKDTKPDNHIYTSCGHILCNHECLDNERQKGAAAGLEGGVCRVCGAVFDPVDADVAKDRVFRPPTTAAINASSIISTYNIPEDSPLERLVRLVCSKCAVDPSPAMLLGLGHALILYRNQDIRMENVLESLTESITDNPDKRADL